MRNNHKIHKNSYSNLYYNYFNPNASMYNNYNILKRQRSKDSYVDIMNERKDFISYEINRKEMGKINSCLTSSKAKNKLESKFKNRNENNKKSVKGTVNHINNINKINNRTFQNRNLIYKPCDTYYKRLKNNSVIVDDKKVLNFNYITSIVSPEANSPNNNDNNTLKENNDINTNKEKDKIKECLEENKLDFSKIGENNQKKGEIIESYSFRVKNENNNLNAESNKKNNDNLMGSTRYTSINEKINKLFFNYNDPCPVENEKSNKPDINKTFNEKNNNESKMDIKSNVMIEDNIIESSNNRIIIDNLTSNNNNHFNVKANNSKNNLENKEILSDKKENKIFNAIKITNHYYGENTFIIKDKEHQTKFMKNVNKLKTNLTKSISCPSLQCIKTNKNCDFSQIFKNFQKKEKNKHILKRAESFFEEKKNSSNDAKKFCPIKYVKENNINDIRLQMLLQKIPKHDKNKKNSNFTKYSFFNRKMNDGKKILIEKNRNSHKNIMPPNDLRNIL